MKDLQEALEEEQQMQERIQGEILAMLRKTEEERIRLRKESIEKERALLDQKNRIELRAWNDNYLQKEREAMMAYLEEYEKYNEKIAAIHETYQEKIKNAGTPGEKQGLQKQVQQELAGVETEMIKSSKVWEFISGELAGFSTQMIQTYLEQAKATLAQSSELSGAEVNKITDAITNAGETIRQRNPFRAMHEALIAYREASGKKDAGEADKQLTAFEDSAEKSKAMIKDITSGASGIAGLISKDLGSVITQIGGISESVVGAIKGFGAAGGKVGDKIKGISGIISACAIAVGDFINAIGESNRAAREFEEFRMQFLNQYYLYLMSIKEEDYDTIFGVETLSRSIDAYGKLTEVSAKYRDSLQTVNHAATRNTVSGDVWGKELHKQNEKRNEALAKGYDAVQSMPILISEANMWQKIWGKGSRYSTLKDLAPEMWDENGKFDVEAAKIFLQTNKEINKSNNSAQKSTIENLVALEEQYEELMTIVRDDLENTFGYIGGAITDQIVNALKSGGDAWENFKDIGIQALETLGKKLMYELFFAQKMKQLQADMEKLYENETDPEVIAVKQANLLDTFFNSMEADVKNAQKWGMAWDKKMTEKGYNLWGTDPTAGPKTAEATTTRTATAQGITSMSQESADELNGNFYALFMTVDEILQFMKRQEEQEGSQTANALPTLQEMLDVSKSSNTYLLDIRNNTSHLIAIDSNIGDMKGHILAIRNEGVKIRS